MTVPPQLPTDDAAVPVGVGLRRGGGLRQCFIVPAHEHAALAAMRALVGGGAFGLIERAVEPEAIAFEREATTTLAAMLGEDTPLPWPQAGPIAIAIAAALSWCEATDTFPGALALDAVWLVQTPARAVLGLDTAIERALGVVAPPGAERSGRLSRWAGPEQSAGAPWDHAANRYVLGLVLYRMLAGRHPFAGLGLRRALEEQASRGAPPLPDAVAQTLPDGVQGFVLRLLDADAERRPRRAAAIEARL
ncbi:MAG: hypothetical protein K1X88_33390, partial [Nannocystaceae bacterium]|nr:hypothetical protein [Nannocystaceae bacterium]